MFAKSKVYWLLLKIGELHSLQWHYLNKNVGGKRYRTGRAKSTKTQSKAKKNPTAKVDQKSRICSPAGCKDGRLESTKKVSESFLFGSAVYLEQMYDLWLKDSSAIHPSWHKYFHSLETTQPPAKQILDTKVLRNKSEPSKKPVKPKPGTDSKSVALGGDITQLIKDHLAVQGVIQNYLARGHLLVDLDPLKFLYPDRTTTISDRSGGQPSDKILRQYKLPMDKSKEFPFPSTDSNQDATMMPLKDIIKKLELSYCRHIGAEFTHIDNMNETNWLREQIESDIPMPRDLQLYTWKWLAKACVLETYCMKKFPNEKRFGLDGCEVLIPMLQRISEVSSMQGVENIIFAVSHRGRQNIITNICAQPLRYTLTHYQGLPPSDERGGDVKYHLGLHRTTTNDRSRKPINYAIVSNPSHLELVSPVAMGKCRCIQDLDVDGKGHKTMAIVTHGDAGFSAQGVSYESINLCGLTSYSTRGTIHIVVNNLIGFTTDPRDGRSSPYCTNLGYVVQAPILHVNADDPESAMKVASIAAQWRQKFHKDLVVDLVGYRRFGHNEQDNPAFTQPLIYQKIHVRPNIYDIYSKHLIHEHVVTESEVKQLAEECEKEYEAEFQESKKFKVVDYSMWMDTPWYDGSKEGDEEEMPQTGISENTIQTIAKKFSSPPSAEFKVHPGISRILKGREQMVQSKIADWSIGEALAFASLLNEGIPVRIAGQDSQRGTFGHRHHVLHDVTRPNVTYNMLEDVFPQQAKYTICNSPLNEMAVLAFEMGYAFTNPRGLVLWEAQFGDFCNMAQPIFDNFLASQETKWRRQCGIVCLLPHGMEGMGSEHSSCRVERFLQMATDVIVSKEVYDEKFVFNQHKRINWFVACCSTPASMFHLIRRQMYLPFRKPLILLTPKSYLRLPEARSPFSEFAEGTMFHRLIPAVGEAAQDPLNVKRLIFCFGKTYYDIMSYIGEAKLSAQVAVARIEQFAPFPYDLVLQEIEKYPNAELVWAQEEHSNQGAWPYMKDRIIAAGGRKSVKYIGRPINSTPATGNIARHREECEKYKKDIIQVN